LWGSASQGREITVKNDTVIRVYDEAGTGWLFYDSMHEHNAANTNPRGSQIWRLTCEEIHPVSGIKVLH
jgi:hypothetical protein